MAGAERAQAGVALRAALLGYTNELVAVCERDGTLRHVDGSVAEVLGTDADELVGRSALDLIHPDDRAAVALALASLDERRKGAGVGAGDPLSRAVSVRVRHGRDGWRQTETTITDRVDDPAIHGWVFTFLDVTRERERAAEHQSLEVRSRALVENSSDVIAVTDTCGVIAYASPSVQTLLGYAPEELVGRPLTSVLDPVDREGAYRRVEEALVSGAGSERVEYRVRHADGSWRHMEAIIRDLTGEPAVRGLVVNARDVTDRKHYELLVAGQAAVLEGLVRGEQLSTVLDDIASLVERTVSHVRCAVVVEGQQDDLPTLDAGGRVLTRAGLPPRTAWTRPVVAPGTGRVLGSIAVVPDEPRQARLEELRVVELAANLAAVALERHAAAERLARQARQDPLTGLPNRQVFLEHLALATESAARAGVGTVAVLFLDIDRFKDVNDEFGHQVGDRVLIELSRRLESSLRAGDLLSRFGGDEFVVLCRVDGPDHAQLVAERVLERIREPIPVGGVDLVLTTSIGIAIADRARLQAVGADGRAETWDELLRDADIAMYRAKEGGRARAAMFDDALRGAVHARIETETALRHAVERHEFEVVYQPLVSLADSSMVGAEALLRWRRPDRGLVLPAEFISPLEQTGLIVPVGEWVLREAVRQAAAWRSSSADVREMLVSVNLSARQFTQDDLVAAVALALETEKLDPSVLCLEITESLLLDDLDGVLTVLEAVRSLGVRVMLDDFGTGYSSLEYLKRLPVDGVKLDRSFVSELDASGPDSVIVGAVVEMAHALGLQVVAEGVEREAQLAELVDLGCDLAQGYLFARPQAAGALAAELGTAVGAATDTGPAA